jgi:hypothetical protein
MTRPRHAMRPHPLRSPGVLVGVPVAAAVAFGAHAVLGIVPVADQGSSPAPSSAPSAAPAAPVQGYGLATAPPPTTLGLLSAPGIDHGTTTGNGASSVPIAGSSTAAHHAGAPAQTVPITRAAAAPPSMMTFSAAHAPAPAAVPAGAAPAAVAPAAAPQAAAPQAVAAAAPQTAQRAAAPAAAPAQEDGGASDQGSSGGSLASLDLGVAKVSLLSFGD